jgi:hypothetical protein
MRNYIRNIVFQLLCIFDGAINLLWSLLGGKVTVVDFASAFMVNSDLNKFDMEINHRQNEKDKHLESLASDVKSSMRENNASEEEINKAVAELNTIRK